MQNNQQLEKFNEVYNQLNEAQKEAVNTLDGPVMVIAGPGTGKTQILSCRIGKILQDTDAQAQNILCLTYTDAGVVAMRKRLLNFIGADAYKVNICTFHAFCNEVIQSNLNLFDKNELDAISDLETIDLFRVLIQNFEKGHALKRYRGDEFYEINNLKSLFAILKKEGWDLKQVVDRCDLYIVELPITEGFFYKKKYKEFSAGDPKQPKIDAEIERVEKLKAALAEYPNYIALMKQKARYDFDDMINWVIEAFKNNKNLLAQYQEQYQYILVDEFQDTSGTQNKIVELLINYWGDNPNVFVVGDDDQSIFRFQGANIANMEGFAKQYQVNLKRIVLTQNYRSTQPILDTAKLVIENNVDRLINKSKELSKDLVASNTKINTQLQQPIILQYETQHIEMVSTTLAIEKLLQSGVPAGKIAVIYKENKYGEALANYFDLKNIPYYSKRNKDLFTIPLAKKIIHILYYLASELDVPYSGDEQLFELLHFDWFGIKPLTIAKHTIAVADNKYKKDDTPKSLRAYLNQLAIADKKELFDKGTDTQIITTINALEKLIKDAVNETVQNLFQNILNDLQVLSYTMQSLNKHKNLEILAALFNFVKDETHRNPTMNLQDLVSMLQTMQQEGIKLPLYQINGTDKGVNLLTCHGCKGLEFAHVFVIGTNAQYWEGKRKPGTPYGIAKIMQLNETENSENINQTLEELRRLFYVALTRAEQHLTVSYFNYDEKGKEKEHSMFIAEMMSTNAIKIMEVTADVTAIQEFNILEMANTQRPVLAQLEEDIISRKLEKFTMNVTALNTYLNCPISFYYQKLIQIPSSKNENTEFGSAVHDALQTFFTKMIQSAETVADKVFPSVVALLNYFETSMHKRRESFTKEQFKKRLEYGPIILTNYYHKYVDDLEKFVAVERGINGVVVKNVPIKGKVDKIEFTGNNVNVVDYKTGDYEKAKKIKKEFEAPNEKNEIGGNYWRQAVFYKILIDNMPDKNWKVLTTEFDFIEPDTNKQYHREKIVITPEDITTVTQQIVTVWGKIQNREFYSGCGAATCHWCNFVKDNKLQIGFEPEEELDEEGDTVIEKEL